MAYIITIAQHKGGAGKTSLAAHLAATWSVDKGRRVALFDLDPQKSLTQWFQVRRDKMGEENTMSLCPSQGWRVQAELTKAKRDADVIVIDSPGRDDLGTRTAVRLADIVVMPVQPSPMDVWASKPTLEMIAKEGTSALIVLNRLPSRAKLTDHLKSADFFDVTRFSTARFVSTSVTVDGTSAKIAGTMTLKGITKPITLDAKFTGAGTNPFSKRETIGFSATTAIKRSDWGMGTGIPLVGDDVALKISVAFEKAG